MSATAVVVLLPEAEPLVGGHRREHTEEGAHGMGAHVTLLYPFVDGTDLDERLDAVREALAGFAAFDVSLAATMRFPENPRVLCLRPEPDGLFRAMTAALTAAFSGYPPYGGKYADPIPHLTVAIGEDALLDRIERELAPALPLRTRAAAATVLARDAAGRWQPASELPFL